MSGPDRITTVISDFGGVLTTPLVQSFAAVQDETGIPFEELGKAMARIEAARTVPIRSTSSKREGSREVDFLAEARRRAGAGPRPPP